MPLSITGEPRLFTSIAVDEVSTGISGVELELRSSLPAPLPSSTTIFVTPLLVVPLAVTVVAVALLLRSLLLVAANSSTLDARPSRCCLSSFSRLLLLLDVDSFTDDDDWAWVFTDNEALDSDTEEAATVVVADEADGGGVVVFDVVSTAAPVLTTVAEGDVDLDTGLLDDDKVVAVVVFAAEMVVGVE